MLILKNMAVYNQNWKEINNECIKNITKRSKPICNFIPTTVNQIIKYVEQNNILTWNIKNTIIEQDCQEINKNVTIDGNKIITIKQCKIKIGITLNENQLNPEINLTPLYTPIELIKIKPTEHKVSVKLISNNNITVSIIVSLISLTFLYSLYLLKTKNNKNNYGNTRYKSNCITKIICVKPNTSIRFHLRGGRSIICFTYYAYTSIVHTIAHA